MTEHAKEPWTEKTFPCSNPGDWINGEKSQDRFSLAKRDYDRAMACVNALAGMKPEKLAGLINACRVLNAPTSSIQSLAARHNLVGHALAELKGDEKGQT